MVLEPLEIGAGFPGTAGTPTACAICLAQHLAQAPSQMQFSLQTLLFLQLLFTLPATAQHYLVCTLPQLQARSVLKPYRDPES